MSDGKRQRLDKLLGGILQKGKRTIEKLGKNVNNSTLRPQKTEKPPRPRKEAKPGRGKKTEKARRTQKPEKPVRAKKPEKAVRAKKPKRPGRGGQGLLAVARDGLIYQNPTLVQLLGMCPTLAISTSLKNGVGMGLAATAVLLGSNIMISLLRKFIPQKVRIAAYIVIIAGFVTVIDMLMGAYLPELSKSLGVYIPLIVVNCIILARAEAFASSNNVLRSAFDGLFMGLGFTVALIALSSVREILGSGSIFGIDIATGVFPPALMIVLPPGGFLVLGFLIALMQKLLGKREGN